MAGHFLVMCVVRLSIRPLGKFSPHCLQVWGYRLLLSLSFGPRTKYSKMRGFGFRPIAHSRKTGRIVRIDASFADPLLNSGLRGCRHKVLVSSRQWDSSLLAVWDFVGDASHQGRFCPASPTKFYTPPGSGSCFCRADPQARSRGTCGRTRGRSPKKTGRRWSMWNSSCFYKNHGRRYNKSR